MLVTLPETALNLPSDCNILQSLCYKSPSDKSVECLCVFFLNCVHVCFVCFCALESNHVMTSDKNECK